VIKKNKLVNNKFFILQINKKKDNNIRSNTIKMNKSLTFQIIKKSTNKMMNIKMFLLNIIEEKLKVIINTKGKVIIII